MSNPAAELVGELSRCKTPAEWPADLFPRLHRMAQQEPALLRDFIELAMDKLPRGGTYIDDPMSFVLPEDWPHLVKKAIDVFAQDPENDVAESVMAYASLQSVKSLHPYLSRIFELGINARSYCAPWPWRESGQLNFDLLKNQLTADGSLDRRWAFEAALETRDPVVVEYALNHVKADDWDGDVNECLDVVGLMRAGDSFLLLYDRNPQHLIFSQKYLSREGEHPTWSLVPDASCQKVRFGGTLPGQRCVSCEQTLHHLITLNGLTIPTCLSCLGWAVRELYFKHDGNGLPEAVVPEGTKFGLPEMSSSLKETTASLVRTPERWVWQDWGLANARENLHRVGGSPCWIQFPQYLNCPTCGHKMRHLLQIDSELPIEEYDGFLWGSGGICYVQWCDGCRISGQFWQCT